VIKQSSLLLKDILLAQLLKALQTSVFNINMVNLSKKIMGLAGNLISASCQASFRRPINGLTGKIHYYNCP
jgi:hypothetical protein